MRPAEFVFRTMLLAVTALMVNPIAVAQHFESTQASTRFEINDSTFGSGSCESSSSNCGSYCSPCQSWNVGERTFFMGLDGSKQPQDFGANAHLGMQTHFAWSGPLIPELGIGYQVGGGITAAANAVQVFELLGENSGRFQAFSTAGLFRRFDNGFAIGAVWDYQYQESFANFSLNQFRIGASQFLGDRDQIGLTAILPSSDATAVFNATTVNLDPIAQGRLFWRRFWDTGTQTTIWGGLAEGHSEENVLTGPGSPKDEVLLFGADILAPLNNFVAVYGEANLMMPPDTGGVDAFLGLQFYRGGGVASARRRQWSPVLPVASNSSFTVDLNR
ncbi:MAG: DUF6666 family protein [Pirellulaceae bacterium]